MTKLRKSLIVLDVAGATAKMEQDRGDEELKPWHKLMNRRSARRRSIERPADLGQRLRHEVEENRER